MTPHHPDVHPRLADYLPGLGAGLAFAGADIFCKLALASGTDVLTMATVRTAIGIVLTAAWIALGPTPVPLTVREKVTAWGVGLLYAGIIFFIFKAIELLTVPMAILTYFSYPVVTGLVSAWLGVEKLAWTAIAAALVAFAGLAVMIGASPSHVGLLGVAFALIAMVCRVAALVVSRLWLLRADARLSTWYSGLASAAVFAAATLATQNWTPPTVPLGWLWIVLIGITTTAGVAAIFVATTRIGPFRTALAMNLEPLLATLLSAIFLGEVFAPLQAAGAAVMIAALFAFQLRR